MDGEQLPVINLVRNFPSLESFSIRLFRLATLMRLLTICKDILTDLAWSSFNASSNCLCKALRNGSGRYESSIYYALSIRRCSLFSRRCRARYVIERFGRPGNDVCSEDLSTQNHHFPPHDLSSILLEHLLLRSDHILC
jgi:hypothetical protein